MADYLSTTPVRAISTRYVSFRAGAEGPNSIAKTSEVYDEMLGKWELIDDLLGGTDVMRAKGVRWLPREPKEEFVQYRNRLYRSFLYCALRDTIERLTAKPFSKPVGMSNEVEDERLALIEDDVDGEGTDLTQFCRKLFEYGVKYGKAHIRVDFSATGGEQTLADELAGKARPFLFAVDPRDVIGWRSEQINTGGRKLTQVRIRECETKPSGTYGEKEVEQIRLMTETGWEIWEAKENSTWVRVSQGTSTLKKIPLVTIYFSKCGFMHSEPPLNDLAELNLCHWQSSSDQRNNLRFIRIGMLSAVGLSADEMEGQGQIVIAPQTLLKSVNPEARFGFIESNGMAAKIGAEDLKHLEEQMEVLGLRPFVQRTSNSTATGKAIDESGTETEIQSWIRAVENGVKEAIGLAAEWLGVAVPDDDKDAFKVDIFDDFGIVTGAPEDKPFLLQCRTAGEITRLTFLKEIKRRGVLSDSVDPEEEAKEAEADFTSSMGDMLNGNGESGFDAKGRPPFGAPGKVQEGGGKKDPPVPPDGGPPEDE